MYRLIPKSCRLSRVDGCTEPWSKSVAAAALGCLLAAARCAETLEGFKGTLKTQSRVHTPIQLPLQCAHTNVGIYFSTAQTHSEMLTISACYRELSRTSRSQIRLGTLFIATPLIARHHYLQPGQQCANMTGNTLSSVQLPCVDLPMTDILSRAASLSKPLMAVPYTNFTYP